MIFEENLQYKHKWQMLGDLPLESKIILKWIGEGKQVLEIGCHSGDFSEWIQKQNCEVTGIEINAKALQEAKPFLKESYCGDIEHEDFWLQLRNKKFDVIMFEHVLEHLNDPWKVLANSKKFLGKNGLLIIALPNISNADSRFNMFFGNFDYEETGVMDKTHLRFFNQKTTKEMILKAGYVIEEYESPWKVNPLREFIDHIPFLTYFRNIFSKSAPRLPKFSANLTDVVMMFKCRPND
ncbi:MAG: class I SAM-dependent methyltransferase [Chitinophagales bacterium]|nr:class I SAM-dependent methyltransferase [Chitinophagales bacterium]